MRVYLCLYVKEIRVELYYLNVINEKNICIQWTGATESGSNFGNWIRVELYSILNNRAIVLFLGIAKLWQLKYRSSMGRFCRCRGTYETRR